jgi:hypothetical protein
MKKKNILRLASNLLWLSFMCLPLTGQGQTVTRNEVQAVRQSEETRTGRTEGEPGEWPESGKLQLRAAAVRTWPDSTETFTAAGKRQSKTVYTYDAAGNRKLEESYSWDGYRWVNSSKAVYAYNAAGNRTLEEYYIWNGGWNWWVNSYKYVYAYDAAGNRTLEESYSWDGYRWTGSVKYTYAYDRKGVLTLWEQYKWKDNQWVKEHEQHYTRKNFNSKVYVNLNVFYDEDGNRQGYALFVQGSGLSWAVRMPEESRMEYQTVFDAHDNLIRVETTVLSDGKRVPFQRYMLKYSNNHPVSVDVYDYDGKDIKEMYYKATNKYDAEGNLTLSESYRKGWIYAQNRYMRNYTQKESIWVRLNKQVGTYDANGNTLSSEYYSWDTSSAGWIGNWKYTGTYDADGRELSYEEYTWETLSGDWIGSWKYVRTYDANGRELSYESYNWDTSSGDWIGSWKETYEERNEYGDVILYKSWSWKNGDWAWTSYTVYYPGGGDPGSTERIGGGEPFAYLNGDNLYVRTVCAEQIDVYSLLNGAKVYGGAVPAGTTTLSAGRLPKGVLVVKGSSGWTRKVVNSE